MFKNLKNTKKLKLTLYIAVILWAGVITQIFVNYMFQGNDKIIEAFSSTDTEFYESRIEIVADYGDKYLSEADKKDLIEHIALSIGLNSDYEMTYKRKENSIETIARKKSKNADTTIALISTEDSIDDNVKEVHQYIVANLVIANDINSVLPYKKRIEEVMKKLEVTDYKTTLKFSGTREGEQSSKEKEKITGALLKHLQAKVVKKVDSEGVYSVYAYTGLIGQYITVERKRININIAMSYDEKNNVTTIHLATPIMNEDY